MRFRAVLEYDGSGFAGWQLQPGRETVQAILERALRTVLREDVRVEASGRTDAGVHASGQVAAFTLRSAVTEEARLQRSLNVLCGPRIRIRELVRSPDDFDPRRWALRRAYEYRIDNREWSSPFTAPWSWHVRHRLDLGAMRLAAHAVIGTHDFRSFQAADCDAKSSVRTIEESDLTEHRGCILYRVTADAFLRRMVRNLVGTFVEIGRGRRGGGEMKTILAAKDRRVAGPTAPPHGLFLVRVDYPGERMNAP